MNDVNVYGETDVVLKNFLSSTLRELMSICEAQGGSLFLFDAEHKELVLDSFYNCKKLEISGIRQRLGEGISGKVIESKLPILVKDIEHDGRFQRNGYKHYCTNSFISIPLISSKGPVGLINLTDKANHEPFSEKDFAAAVTLVKYFCTIIEDILLFSKLKKEWEAVHKQQVSLAKYASVGKLAAGVVHEINNPLDGIIRYTNMLLNQIEDNSVNKEYLIEIKNGLNRIANITRSLLEFSSQVNSTSARVNKYIDIHQLIEDSLENLKNKVNGNIRVEKNYLPGLPKILDLNLSHVFVNIIRNALESMPAGGKLEISTGFKDSYVEITVKDTGLGIPAEIMEHIFEPFFTTKKIEKGTGLGLSISREIIEKYKGRIEVCSFPGQGSKFIILLPRRFLENA